MYLSLAPVKTPFGVIALKLFRITELRDGMILIRLSQVQRPMNGKKCPPHPPPTFIAPLAI
jgi:hypothetical protein